MDNQSTPPAVVMNALFTAVIIVIIIALLMIIIYATMTHVPAPTYIYTYTIWTGSEAFGVGHSTDRYEIKNDCIIFYNTRGKKITIPLTNVYSIVEE